MKQRILVAVVGIPALLAVLCVAPAWATALLLAALSVIAAHELLTAVSGPDKARRWTVLPALCAVLLLGRQVFSWPGLGYLAVQSIIYRDFQLVQGIVLWIALMYMVINLVVDISYNRLDPRLRKEGR